MSKKNDYQTAITTPDGKRLSVGMVVQQRHSGGLAKIRKFLAGGNVLVEIPTINNGLFVAYCGTEHLEEFVVKEEAEEKADSEKDKSQEE